MARLVNWVYVDGHGWVEPDKDVPAEVAEKITNPKAWKSGHTPKGVDEDEVEVNLTPAEPDETWKIDRLRDHAALHQVDVTGLRSKAEILDALKKAQK